MHRKFVQTSVVLLSPLAYVGLLKQLVELVGPLYFEKGPHIFQKACAAIAQWPKPRAGLSLRLELENRVWAGVTPIQSVTAQPSRRPGLLAMKPDVASPGSKGSNSGLSGEY